MTQAGTLLMALRRRGVELEAPEAGGLHYRAPAGVVTPELRRRLVELKVDLRDLVAAEAEALRLHREILSAWEVRTRADLARNAAEVERRDAEIARLQEPYGAAMERYWALAGDDWEQLLNGIAAAAAPQRELAGVR